MDLFSEIESLPKSKRRSKISWLLELEEHKTALERGVLLGVKRTDIHKALHKAGIKAPYKVLSEFLGELESNITVCGTALEKTKKGVPKKNSNSVPQIPGKKSLSEAYQEKKRSSQVKFRVSDDNL